MRAVAIALAMGLLASAASAQTTAPDPQAPAIATDAMMAARAVVAAQGGAEGMQAVLSALRNSVVQNLANLSHKPPSEVAGIVDEVVLPEARSHIQELVDIVVGLYGTHFTVEELRELLAFYQTPVGRKLTALQPVLAQERVAAAQAWGRRVFADVVRKHSEELRQRGLKI